MSSHTDELLEVIAALRHPETGCPWDLKQTHRSLIPFLVEESYEVIDRIERDDAPGLREELGDVLLQVLLHARIAEEAGQFDFHDIAKGLSNKLVRRHPHVFSDVSYASEAEQKAAWEAFKQQEREAADASPATSALDGVAPSLPALMRAHQLQKRAARVGFDWDEPGPVFDKIEEELAEVREVLQQGESKQRLREEIGDLLFAVVNLSRHLGINAEEALRQGNHKFEHRFRQVEASARKAGQSTEDVALEQLEAWWEEAKNAERS